MRSDMNQDTSSANTSVVYQCTFLYEIPLISFNHILLTTQLLSLGLEVFFFSHALLGVIGSSRSEKWANIDKDFSCLTSSIKKRYCEDRPASLLVSLGKALYRRLV